MEHEDEPWSKKGLRSSKLGWRTCLVSITRTGLGLEASCCHPQCNAHELPTSCVCAAFPGPPELGDVAGRHTSAWLAEMTTPGSGATMPPAVWTGMIVRPDRPDFELTPASARVSGSVQTNPTWSGPADAADDEVDADADQDEDVDDGFELLDRDPAAEASPTPSPLKLPQSQHTAYVKTHLSQAKINAEMNALMKRLVDEHRSEGVAKAGPVPMTSNSTRQHKGVHSSGRKSRGAVGKRRKVTARHGAGATAD